MYLHRLVTSAETAYLVQRYFGIINYTRIIGGEYPANIDYAALRQHTGFFPDSVQPELVVLVRILYLHRQQHDLLDSPLAAAVSNVN